MSEAILEIHNCPNACRERHLRFADKLECDIPNMSNDQAAIAQNIVRLMRRPKNLHLGRTPTYTGEVLSAVVACFAHALFLPNVESIVRVVIEDMGHTGSTFQVSNLHDRIPVLSGHTLKWILIRTLAKERPLYVI